MACDVAYTCCPEKNVLFLNFDVSHCKITLDVFVYQDDGTKLILKIFKAPFSKELRNEMRAGLAILYGCVHSLLLRPVEDPPDCLAGKCCDGPHSVFSTLYGPASVIHCVRRDVVVKFYDSSDRQPPPEECLKAVGLSKVSSRRLNDRVSIMEYGYVSGSSIPSSVSSYVGVIRKHSLHSLGYVHGDIKMNNLYFHPRYWPYH